MKVTIRGKGKKLIRCQENKINFSIQFSYFNIIILFIWELHFQRYIFLIFVELIYYFIFLIHNNVEYCCIKVIFKRM